MLIIVQPGMEPCKHEDPGGGQCQKLISVMNDNCGHTAVVKCSMLDEATGIIDQKFKFPPCPQICSTFLPCGHYCAKQCHSKLESHDCQNSRKCQKDSVCGHTCLQTHPCKMDCPPCNTIVTYRPKKMLCPHFNYGPCWLASQDLIDKANKCILPCTKYTCGLDHQCSAPCNHHHDKEGGNLQCPNKYCVKTCNKKLNCGHSCPLTCDNHPMGPDGSRVCPPCEDGVTTVMCPRQLHQVILPCDKITEVPTCKDERLVDVMANCGHLVHNHKVICSENNERKIRKKAHKNCTESCTEMLACGHSCPGRCVKCYNSSYHERCSEPCLNILICNHPCETPCSNMCGPCHRFCERECEHGPCPKECCLPCIKCEEPCTYNCPHLRCSKKCHEICDRAPCQNPCRKTLPCGHFCTGFCGELCPSLCCICDKDTLLAEMLLGETEIEEDDRFIFLPACGHTISSNFMDGFMNATTLSESLSYEINPKRCPLCQMIIYNCRRYSAIVNQYKDDIDKAKKAIQGDYMQIVEINSSTRSKLLENKSPHFRQFRNSIYFRLCIESEQNFKSMDIGVARSLKYLTAIYSELTLLVGELKAKHVPKVYADAFASADHYVTITAGTRTLPLTKQEVEEINWDLTRFRDLRRLYLFHSERQSAATLRLILAQKDHHAFSAAKRIVSKVKRYSYECRLQVFRHFKAISESLCCKLNISDVERKMIVESFGPGHGRFFRCHQGHIYVITECGGAMEEGVCSECKAVIGGSQHLVHEGNQLATEMDGAVTPLWPNSVQ